VQKQEASAPQSKESSILRRAGALSLLLLQLLPVQKGEGAAPQSAVVFILIFIRIQIRTQATVARATGRDKGRGRLKWTISRKPKIIYKI
jgi:hypothetical protein